MLEDSSGGFYTATAVGVGSPGLDSATLGLRSSVVLDRLSDVHLRHSMAQGVRYNAIQAESCQWSLSDKLHDRRC